MVTNRSEAGTAIEIKRVETQTILVALIGESPIILNRVSEKAQRELALPSGRKTQAERQATLKHEPLKEFRAAAETFFDDSAPTLLAIPSGAVKGAMMTAALDLPGAKKAQIGRLVSVLGELIPVWGTPKLLMSVVRSADMNRTSDIRTRVIVPKWAALVEIKFVATIIKEASLVNLLSAGGETCGLGDWRAEKGKGNYGSFAVASPDDLEFLEIVNAGGRAAQSAAMERAEPYNRSTSELLEWVTSELTRREQTGLSSVAKAPKRKAG